jgi:hypothetical protein
MARTAFTAPAHTVLQRMPGQFNPLVSSVAPDAAPSLCYGGSGLQDHRMAYNKYNALGNGLAAAIVGWSSDSGACVLDQLLPTAPVAGTGGISTVAGVTSGTPLALTTATTLTNGALVTASALTTMPFLTVIPAGTVVIQSQMNYLKLGIRDITAFYDPTNACTRSISVTGVASGTGGAFTVRGADVYGQLMSEVITATAGATTVSGKKAWKWIFSITPGFTDAHAYTFDVNTLVGLNLAVDSAGYVDAWVNGAFTSSPTVTGADTTSPATGTTGDVRGTLTVVTPGGNRVTVFASPSAARQTQTPLATGLFGVTNFTN